MKTPHMQHHWIVVTLVLIACLLAVSEVHGQARTNNSNTNITSDPVFQGRPAMSGAQGGLGAMAGPAQGGIGLQGTTGSGVRKDIIRNDTLGGPPPPPAIGVETQVIDQDSKANRAVVDDAATLRERGTDRPAATHD